MAREGQVESESVARWHRKRGTRVVPTGPLLGMREFSNYVGVVATAAHSHVIGRDVLRLRMGAAACRADVSRAIPCPDDENGSVPRSSRWKRAGVNEDGVSGADARDTRDTILPVQDHAWSRPDQVEIIGREVEAWQHVRHGLLL